MAFDTLEIFDAFELPYISALVNSFLSFSLGTFEGDLCEIQTRRFYFDRTTGCDRYHRRIDRVVAARRSASAGSVTDHEYH